MAAPRKLRSQPQGSASSSTKAKAGLTPAHAAIRLGPQTCSDLATAERREWLVTNGIGGFASGTVAGTATRRYHGLLIASLELPAKRTHLVGGIDEIVRVGDGAYELATHRWLSGAVAPQGYRLIREFRLEGLIPAWTYQAGSALVEKRVWMQHGENTTFVRYSLLESTSPVELEGKVLVNYRDFHAATHAGFAPNDWHMRTNEVEYGVQIIAFDDAVPFFLKSATATCEARHIWYRDFFFPCERERGLPDREDQLLAAIFRAQLKTGQSVTLVFSTNSGAPLDGEAGLKAERNRQAAVLKAGKPALKLTLSAGANSHFS